MKTSPSLALLYAPFPACARLIIPVRLTAESGTYISNQENPGGFWVFPKPTPYFADLLAAESG